MTRDDLRWTPGASSVEVRWPDGFLDSARGRGLEHWIDEWRGEASSADNSLSLPYSLWAEIGAPPAADASEEELDLYRARHAAAARLLGLSPQQVLIESVGHVGSDISFLFSVNGVRVGEMVPPTPFPRDGAGVVHPLLPAAFVAFARICEWNASARPSRAAQIVFLSDLQQHLERASSLLAESAVPLTYELDPHLREFRTERPAAVALGWTPKRNGALFDLEVEKIETDGSRAPLDLNKLDPDNPIIELSATEHILLDPEMAAVARIARKQRNKLRKHVEPHLHSPATLLPEGLSLDTIDLSAYSPRVLGFEPIVKAERDADIQSSGVEWYQSDDDGSTAFLRLFVSQPGGGIEVLELSTPEEASEAITKLEQALQSSTPEAIDVGGRRVVPTKPLLDRLQHEMEVFRARTAEPDEAGASAKGTERSRRGAAKISEEYDGIAQARDSSADLEVPWPTLEGLLAPTCELKPHQRDGIAWMWAQYKRRANGVLLADDMGLGKTLQIAAFLALQRAMEPELKQCPTLIVAPVILLENWQDELEKFFRPEVFGSLLVLYGEELRRRKRGAALDVGSIRERDYVLTNYETLQSHQQSLLLLDWNVVVLDEAQAIKNPDTYRARAARGLKRKFGICSTGTPVENRLGDLWSLYDFLSPGDPFRTPEEFSSEYEQDLSVGIPKVREALRYPGAQSSLLRRTKAEVLSLPEKTTHVHAVAMTPEQVALERQVTRQGEEQGNVLKILQGLQKLYQHPRLLVPEAHRSAGFSIERALEESPKLALCVQLLREIQAAGEKALVFTLWVDMQSFLVDVFKKELGLRHVRIINGDPKQRKKAHQYIKEFSAVDGFNVMVLSPLAAGTGLTITAANHVIHYGRWWNPAKEDQATDRAYRIGQQRPVHVHYPVLHHPGKPDVGFDVKLHELVERKRGMARDFLAPQTHTDISLQDLAALQES